MQMTRFRSFPIFMAFMVFSLPFFTGLSAGSCETRTGSLNDTYERMKTRLENTPFDVPIVVETHDDKSRSQCDVYGIVHHDFKELCDVLSQSKNWCDILLLHPNTKACTVAYTNQREILTLYCGRKYYQAPDTVTALSLAFHVERGTTGNLDISMSGDKGPLNTDNYEIRINAVPLEKGEAFIHLSYAYDCGLAFKSALRMYLATLGRGKIGFTITGRDKKGDAVYTRGAQGMIERNSVRYYLSIQAFLETFQLPEAIRFKSRISRYYDMMNKYPKQLYELDKEEYEANKIREYHNQTDLQKKIQTQRRS